MGLLSQVVTGQGYTSEELSLGGTDAEVKEMQMRETCRSGTARLTGYSKSRP